MFSHLFFCPCNMMKIVLGLLFVALCLAYQAPIGRSPGQEESGRKAARNTCQYYATDADMNQLGLLTSCSNWCTNYFGLFFVFCFLFFVFFLFFCFLLFVFCFLFFCFLFFVFLFFVFCFFVFCFLFFVFCFLFFVFCFLFFVFCFLFFVFFFGFSLFFLLKISTYTHKNPFDTQAVSLMVFMLMLTMENHTSAVPRLKPMKSPMDLWSLR